MKNGSLTQDFMSWAAKNRNTVWNYDDPVVVAEWMGTHEPEIQEGIAKSREKFIQVVDDARCKHPRQARGSKKIANSFREILSDKRKNLLRLLLQTSGRILQNEDIERHFPQNELNLDSIHEFRNQCLDQNIGLLQRYPSGYLFTSSEYTGLPTTTLGAIKGCPKEDPLLLNLTLNALAIRRPQVVTYAKLAELLHQKQIETKRISRLAGILNDLGADTGSFHLQVKYGVGYRLLTTAEQDPEALQLIKDMRLHGNETNFMSVLLSHMNEFVSPSQLRMAAIPSSCGEKALTRLVSTMNKRLKDFGYQIESDIGTIGSVKYVAGYALRRTKKLTAPNT